ncbi:unnamed protein product [Caenorhabditis brenneri]
MASPLLKIGGTRPSMSGNFSVPIPDHKSPKNHVPRINGRWSAILLGEGLLGFSPSCVSARAVTALVPVLSIPRQGSNARQKKLIQEKTLYPGGYDDHIIKDRRAAIS